MITAGDNFTPPTGSPRRGLRLLVVDDHRDAADSLALLLSLWGHEPHVAYDGASALKVAGSHPPDAVILDLGLPGRDGCELAGDLRRQEGWDGAALIALTGFTDTGRRRSAKAAGFEHFLVKPVEPDTLQRLLGELLELRLLVRRLDQLAGRHAELAKEAAHLGEAARQHVRELEALLQGGTDADRPAPHA